MSLLCSRRAAFIAGLCYIALLAVGCSSEQDRAPGAKSSTADNAAPAARPKLKPAHPNAVLVVYRPDGSVAESMATVTATNAAAGSKDFVVDSKKVFACEWNFWSSDGSSDEYTVKVTRPGDAEPIEVPAFLGDKPRQLTEHEGFRLVLEPSPPSGSAPRK
jgi:hypothetical protein